MDELLDQVRGGNMQNDRHDAVAQNELQRESGESLNLEPEWNSVSDAVAQDEPAAVRRLPAPGQL